MIAMGKIGKASATRQQILDAALRVIAEKGYSAATVDEIVKEAGVSKGLAYYHFKSKADMASSILECGVDSLIDSFDEVVSRKEDSGATLVGMLDVFASTIFDNQEFGRFFVSELWRSGRAWSDELGDKVEKLVAMIAGEYRKGQEEGTVRQGIDIDFHAVAVIGLVLTTSMYYIDDGLGRATLDKQGFVDRICDYARHATATEDSLV